MNEDPARRAGAHWRVLVHNMAAHGATGACHDIKSHPGEGNLPSSVGNPETRRRIDEAAAQHRVQTVLPGTEFDEVVVGKFLHLEQMDGGRYWLNVGGVHVNIEADRDGRPTHVHVELVPEEGVAYSGEVES